MANANPKSRPPKQERTLTVTTSGYQPPDREGQELCIETLLSREVRPYVNVPCIRLSGQWLAAAGFEHRHRVRVEVSQGRLVITHL